ncbi:alpha/beta hydrolase family protein [candidate division KSB1 bacterium]
MTRSVLLLVSLLITSASAQESETYNRRPVADDTYQAYLEFFNYDRELPLEGRVAYVESGFDGYRREKLVFRSCGGDLVPGFLALPNDSTLAPFPVILAAHGAGDGITSGKNKTYIREWMDVLTAAGYAVLAIDAKYYNERAHEAFFAGTREMMARPHLRRDAFIQTVVDWRRGIDYLESRPDIDTDRLGFVGSSMGTMYGMILCAVDQRILAAIFKVGGMFPDERAPRPPIDQINYIGRIAPRPLLMVNGLKDAGWATTGAKKIYGYAGEPKKNLWYDTGHDLPTHHFQDEMVSLFRRHLKGK